MGLGRDEAGNIFELDEAGNAVRLVQQATGAPSAIIAPPNPARVAKEQRQESRQDAIDRRSEEDQRRQEEKDRRDALEWTATHNADGSPKAKAQGTGKPMPDGVAKRYEEAINAFASFDRAVNGFQDDYAGNTITGGLENSAQNLVGSVGTPGQAQWWSDFRATDNVLRNALYGASLTAGEKAAYEATTITPRMDPSQIKDNLQRRMSIAKDVLSRRTNFLKHNGYDPEAVDALSGEYGDMLAGKAQQQADTELPDPATGALPKDPGTDRSPPNLPPENGPAPPDMAVAAGDTKSDYSARLSAQVNSLINAGAGESTINAILKQQGYPTLKPGTYQAARNWMQKTGKRFPLSNTIVDRDVPLSIIEKTAASPVGAYFANAADAGTGGITTAMGGDKARGALDAMNDLHPEASLAGTVMGGVGGAAGLEMGVAARAPTALARFAPRIADAIYGGVTGFNNAEEGEGGTGALKGAGAGIFGGMVGDRVVRGVGALTTGVRNPAVQLLRDRGIPLTVGQTVGDAGTIGRTVEGVEDALTSIPGVGNMIDARRLEGLQGFNRAAFQDAAAPGAPITATGSEGMGQVRQSVNNAYRGALDPVTIDPTDPQFGVDLMSTIDAAQAIPNVNSAQDAALAGLQTRIDGAIDPTTGDMSGRGFQEAYRGLARTGRERANSDYGHEVGQVMRQGQDALAGVLERQNPGAFDNFIEANAANRRANVLADALKNAGNQADELITPAQLNRADITSTSRMEGRINSASGNRPFYDLARAGQEVLPSKLLDSGTAKRAIIGALTTGTLGGTGALMGGGEGGAIGTGGGLLTAAALIGGGTRTGQRVLTRLLADRPDMVLRIAEQFDNNPALGQILRRLSGGAGALGATSAATP